MEYLNSFFEDLISLGFIQYAMYRNKVFNMTDITRYNTPE